MMPSKHSDDILFFLLLQPTYRQAVHIVRRHCPVDVLLLIVNSPIKLTDTYKLNRQTTGTHGDGQLAIAGSLLEGWVARRRTRHGRSPVGTPAGESAAARSTGTAGRWGGTAGGGEELDLLGGADATHI